MRKRLVGLASLAAVAMAMLASTAGGAAFAASFGNLPSAGALSAQSLASDTLIYDRTGQVLLADMHPAGYQHFDYSLSSMGRYLPEATVAVEDASFWTEPGIDPLSIARAALADLRAHAAVQGGSTITQQLVKDRLVGSGSTITRKLREAVLAEEVSSSYSKSQILQMYLNAISYGNAAYGAGTAARVYFHRDPAQLDLAQAALLAGLPQNPTLLDPLLHWEAARQRQREVLDAMVRTRVVTAEQADAAYTEDLSPPDHLFGPATVDVTPGFVDYVESELTDRLGKDVVRRGGLRVVTTLDLGLQQLGQQTIADTVQANAARDVSDGALVAMDPGTGQVLAMVGSAGPAVPGGQYNLAVWPPRSPGSSFKVFTYAAAIDSRNYTMVTPITDQPLLVQPPGDKSYMPRNYDLAHHGVCQLQACLGNSLNVPAVQVELGTGIATVVNVARSMGAPPYKNPSDGQYTLNDPATSFGPALTLGAYGETPLQMATGVSVLADRGVLHAAEAILNVSAPDRQVYAASGAGSQVIDPGTAFIVSQMLSDDANRALIFGRGTPLVLAGRTAAVKTGTSENFTDGWTVGYTPSLVAAVWMGNADYHPLAKGTDGIVIAGPAWHDFMSAALDRMRRGDEWYDPPADVQSRPGFGRRTWFLTGTSPATPPPPLPGWAHLGVRDPGPPAGTGSSGD